MHLKVRHHKWIAIAAISLPGALSPVATVRAELVTLQNATQATTDAAALTGSVLSPAAFAVDDRTWQAKTDHIQREQTPNQSGIHTQNAATALLGAHPEPGSDEEIQSTVKDSVLLLLDQRDESGTQKNWHDLNSDMGLNKSPWDQEEAAAFNPRIMGRPEATNSDPWQVPDYRPRTAAQAEIDRDRASHMLEALIDEIKPLAFALLGLFLLGYLIRAGFDYAQRRSIRKHKREAERARRRSARRAKGVVKPG